MCWYLQQILNSCLNVIYELYEQGWETHMTFPSGSVSEVETIALMYKAVKMKSQSNMQSPALGKIKGMTAVRVTNSFLVDLRLSL